MFYKYHQIYLKFCTKEIIKYIKNPYIRLSHAQLINITKFKIQQSIVSIHQLNILVQLGIALHCNHMMVEFNEVARKCFKELENVDDKINLYKVEELLLLQFGEFINLFINCFEEEFDQKLAQKITHMYVNTYSYIFSFQQQLKIYENTRHEKNFDYINQVACDNIKKIKKQRQLNLSQFINYIRLFHKEIKLSQITEELARLKKNGQIDRINEEDKLILSYVMIACGAQLSLIRQLSLYPDLTIFNNDDSKWTCIKLQIIKRQKMAIPTLNKIDISGWKYSHLIWISQFVDKNDSVFKQKLHKKILSCELPKLTKPSTILIYATNTQISDHKHIEISEWLCHQKNVKIQYQQNLCEMLVEIHQKKWYKHYEQFYKMVAKISLGNFKWQSYNMIYYFGKAWKIEDENIQYIRRYIINIYASLGTARKQIPIQSYFYKILQESEVKNFYNDN